MNHEEIWDRLPWLVNGRADDAERARIETHLKVCADCRHEVAAQRQVMGAIANDKRIDSVPGPAFQRLWDRISAAETAEASARRANAGKTARTPQPAQPLNTRNRSITRWLAAAVIVEAIGLLALTTALSSREDVVVQPPAEYRTVTSATTHDAHGIIRAVFAPTLRVSDLQQLLEESRLQIVAGPTEAGVYTLAASGAASAPPVETALTGLRANPAVRFAEPIGK